MQLVALSLGNVAVCSLAPCTSAHLNHKSKGEDVLRLNLPNGRVSSTLSCMFILDDPFWATFCGGTPFYCDCLSRTSQAWLSTSHPQPQWMPALLAFIRSTVFRHVTVTSFYYALEVASSLLFQVKLGAFWPSASARLFQTSSLPYMTLH